ncbi:MAG: hypothetical protein J0J02_11530 [Thiobacillus sp.]|nr:hypothetical protein [Thiobacillus sp.]
MAATINKVRLITFFHTRRELQTFHDSRPAVKHCFNWNSRRVFELVGSHPRPTGRWRKSMNPAPRRSRTPQGGARNSAAVPGDASIRPYRVDCSVYSSNGAIPSAH